MPTSCRCCLICLLVYLLLPNYSANSRSIPDPIKTTDTTYVPLVDKNQNDPDETKFLQLSLNEDNSTDHKHDASQPQHYFVHLLMEKYGNGTDIAFEGFEHLLVNIGLGKFLQFDHSVKCHKINGSSFVALHSDHNHTGEIRSDAFNRSCDGVQSHVTHSHDHHVSEDDDDHRDDTGHEHETGHDHTEIGHVNDHTDTGHKHNETGHEHEHNETGHEHDHTETDHEHEHTETGHDHEHTETGHEHDHTETGHEHDHIETDHEHDHTETDHDHTETDHDHTETGHEHTETDHEHEHTETDHEHDHTETGHEHDHTETDHEHDHTETDHEHDHTETDHAHDHTETGHEHVHTETDHEHTKIFGSREGSENTEVKKDLVADAEKQVMESVVLFKIGLYFPNAILYIFGISPKNSFYDLPD